MTNFSRRLKKLRTCKGITQKQCGHIFALSEKQYQNYEIGKSTPNFKNLILIADYFGVSIDYLVGRTDETAINKTQSQEILDDFSEEDIEIITKYKRLDGNGKAKIQERLDTLLGI
ncbi:transcriptional regulator [Clostridia bacterium]|nr:transcriptional regulator [Clostridia bacterium]